jgi:hypothetical protein
LASLDSDQGKALLIKEVSELKSWIIKKEKENDSSDAYIFSNVLAKDLYQHADSHLAISKNLISDEHVDEGIKKILIKLSQCLSLENYLTLGEVVYATNNKNLIITYLSPGPQYGFTLDQHHSDINVVEFLKKTQKKFPDLKNSIELTISGSTLTSYVELIRFGENFPALSCHPTQ